MSLLLRQPLPVSLLTRPLRYPLPMRLISSSHARSLQVRFISRIATQPQLIPPVDLEMLQPLLVSEGGSWTLAKDGYAIERGVQFGTFEETRKFIDALGGLAQSLAHHPEWANIYKHVYLRLKTHKDRVTGEKGISILDLEFARFCDTEIIKQNGASDTRLRSGDRGINLLKELEVCREVAGTNGAPSNKDCGDLETRGVIDSEQPEEDEETRVSVDKPVVIPAQEKGLRRLASEGRVEEQEGAKSQDEVSDSAEFSGKYGRERGRELAMEHIQRRSLPSLDGKDEQKREGVQKEIDEVPKLLWRKTPALPTDGRKKLPTLQPARNLSEDGDCSSYEVWIQWKKTMQSSYQGETSWGRLLKEASELGIPRVWARRQIHEYNYAYGKETPASTPSPATSIEASIESHPDQPPSIFRMHRGPLQDRHSNDRSTLRTGTDRRTVLATTSGISASQEEPASTSLFPSAPNFSRTFTPTDLSKPEPHLGYKEVIASKRQAAKEAKATVFFSSFPSRAHSPDVEDNDNDDEDAPQRPPESKRGLRRAMREAEKEEKVRRRQDEHNSKRKLREKRSKRRAEAVTKAKALATGLNDGASLKAETFATRSKLPHRPAVPREVALDMPSSFSVRDVDSYEGHIKPRPRELAQQGERGAPRMERSPRGREAKARVTVGRNRWEGRGRKG